MWSSEWEGVGTDNSTYCDIQQFLIKTASTYCSIIIFLCSRYNFFDVLMFLFALGACVCKRQ